MLFGFIGNSGLRTGIEPALLSIPRSVGSVFDWVGNPTANTAVALEVASNA